MITSTIIIYIIGVVLSYLIGDMTYKKMFKDGNMIYPKGAYILVALVSLTAYLGLIAWIVIAIPVYLHSHFK